MDDKIDFSLGTKQALTLVLTIGIALGLAGGVAGTLLLTDSQSSNVDAEPSDTSNQQPSDSGSQEQDSTVSINFDNQDEPVIGQQDAPVTMVYWGDFQCQYCGRFETGELRQPNDPSTDGAYDGIKEEYIDTGKVKFVSKSFTSSRHEWGQEAANVMECVYQEGGNNAFWKLKDKVYENQDSFNTSNVKSKILDWASQEGISNSNIQSCLDSRVESEIQGDKREAVNTGLRGTPSFVVYKSGADSGTKIVGSQPYTKFRSVIENELNNQN